MGCWNGTCGLTNLPIHDGEEMYVFPVLENDLSSYRSHCYSSALYKPMLTPFVSVYNDYGAGEKSSGIALDIIMESIQENLVELEIGKNTYHDIAVKKEGFTVDTFFEAAHEDRLFVQGYGKKSAVYFTMVRKDIVDNMFNLWKFDMYMGEGKASNPADCYERDVTYAKQAEYIPEFIDTIKRTIEDADDEISRYYVPSSIRDISNKIPMLKYLCYSFDSSEHWRLTQIEHKLVKFITEGRIDDAIELARIQLLGTMVNRMMESTRKIWLPVMHQGSQSQSYDTYKFLNQLTSDVIAEREKLYEE